MFLRPFGLAFLLCTPQGPQLGAMQPVFVPLAPLLAGLLVEADEQLVASKACLDRACQLQVQQQEEEAAALEQMRQQAAAAWPASLTTLARARAVLRDAEAEQAAAELEFAHVQRVREAWRSRYNRMLCSYHPPGRKQRFSHLRLMWVSWGFPFNYLA